MKIGVLGAGTMGSGIAQVAMQAGFSVLLVDLKEELVERGIKRINKSLQSSVEKGKVSAIEMEGFLNCLNASTTKESLRDVDIVIEAIAENIEVKRKAYAELNVICRPQTIFACNTSSLSITEIAAASNRPDRVVGMHFFNPVPVMKLVEIVPGLNTSQNTVDVITELAKSLGKVSINVKEFPGFAVNRILVPMLNEAIITLQEGIASAEEIDTGMKLGANMPMGPLALADLVGLDVLLAVIESFYKEFADSKYRPAILLKNMVRAGHFGVKSGKGFYDYSDK